MQIVSISFNVCCMYEDVGMMVFLYVCKMFYLTNFQSGPIVRAFLFEAYVITTINIMSAFWSTVSKVMTIYCKGKQLLPNTIVVAFNQCSQNPVSTVTIRRELEKQQSMLE